MLTNTFIETQRWVYSHLTHRNLVQILELEPLYEQFVSVAGVCNLIPVSVLNISRPHKARRARKYICVVDTYNLSGGGVRFLPSLKAGVSTAPAPPEVI